MGTKILTILIVALGWHLTIIGASRFVQSRRRKPSLKRLLRLIEMDLAKDLADVSDRLSDDEMKEFRYSTLLKEADHRLGRLENGG